MLVVRTKRMKEPSRCFECLQGALTLSRTKLGEAEQRPAPAVEPKGIQNVKICAKVRPGGALGLKGLLQRRILLPASTVEGWPWDFWTSSML